MLRNGHDTLCSEGKRGCPPLRPRCPLYVEETGAAQARVLVTSHVCSPFIHHAVSHHRATAQLHTLCPHSQVIETLCIIGAAVAVAVAFPTQAEKIFALTGCTAVCLACYCIPVFIHLKLEERLLRHSGGDLLGADCLMSDATAARPSLAEPLLVEASKGGGKFDTFHSVRRIQCLVGPAIILMVGVGCSAAGLYVSLRDMWETWGN